MSTGRAIEAVTQTLRSVLGPVTALVTARPPDQARGAGASGDQLNLFLYDVAPNAAWRNLEPPARSGGGGLHPPLALDLHYLLTAYADHQDETTAHRLLGQAMQVLHDGAVLTRAKLGGVLGDAGVHLQPERVRLTPVHLGLDEQSKLWSGFQTPYRLSVAYRASVVLIDTGRPSEAPLPVLRRGRGPLDALGRDEGVPASAGSTAPRLDRITVAAWRGNASLPARSGDQLVLDGAGLAGGPVRARFDHPRLAEPVWAAAGPGSTAEQVRVPLPGTLPAGVATVTVAVGPAAGPALTSNALPLPVAVRLGRPVLGAAGARDVLVTVPCDRLQEGQSVLLLAGGDQLAPVQPARAGVAPSFRVPRPASGGARLTLRLRVDGIDSIPLADPDPDPAEPLPTVFDPAQQVVLP
ncbi:DUF4255 domain-containing protein [Kitasatospora sp. CM 4170]|uniref:DUF4255 domain-containing protein n=1 Tax=Kitasatospora aburaviensis TaxID=67265 RepID=A0ABW1EU32_9ACTN|nr:DUF4255 domain-containing protein [Kitasatospora sp. CM 4170]WNM44452.1 DUF4255 domain-containing protein [Kitasatospora sp. CM 4170]